MEQQVNAASSLISFMSQPPEIGSGQIDGNWESRSIPADRTIKLTEKKIDKKKSFGK
jgi:hypothetical protein